MSKDSAMAGREGGEITLVMVAESSNNFQMYKLLYCGTVSSIFPGAGRVSK